MLFVSSIWALISSLFFSLFSHCIQINFAVESFSVGDLGWQIMTWVLLVNVCCQSVKIYMLWPAEEPKYSPASYAVVASDGELWATWFFSSSWKQAVSGFCKTDMYEDFHIVIMTFYLRLNSSWDNILKHNS